ncbi:hypothetical protein DPMN_111043 [Dreissena polymorpha]|uniref:Uncharacterized protein n=1 Tax=Dreissena polymorpha TaxID=45954 RepID=A0A9D4QNK9_DREPO|nr:hypothetical protein DPMN_111043 [Dreissena polymorpha]
MRSDLILSSLPKEFLLEPGMNLLRKASLASGFLFGGRIQKTITADREDQLYASLARKTLWTTPMGLKASCFRAPPVPAAKNAKRSNLFSERPFSSRSVPNRLSSYTRLSFSQKFSD